MTCGLLRGTSWRMSCARLVIHFHLIIHCLHHRSPLAGTHGFRFSNTKRPRRFSSAPPHATLHELKFNTIHFSTPTLTISTAIIDFVYSMMILLQDIVVKPTSLSVVNRSIERIGSFPVNRIYCIGRNYAEHAKEMGHNPSREPPFFFQKPANSILNCSDSLTKVPFPSMTSNLHYEGEMVVALGAGGSQLTNEQAISCIYGYAVGCDLTRRDLQNEAKKLGRPWDVAKGFDCSAPCGPLIPKHEIEIGLDDLLQLRVDNELLQECRIHQMIWSVPETISILSHYFRLMPGDLIMTGTPAGVGKLEVGNTVRITCGDLPPCEFTMANSQD